MELPIVQCKDCFNCGILRVDSSNWVDFDPRVQNILKSKGKWIHEIRMNYCLKVNLVVDLSTPRKCGCFTKIREEDI